MVCRDWKLKKINKQSWFFSRQFAKHSSSPLASPSDPTPSHWTQSSARTNRLAVKSQAQSKARLHCGVFLKASKCGISKRISEWIGGTEQRPQKRTHVSTVNWTLAQEQRRRNGARTVQSTRGAGTTGVHVQKLNETPYTHHENKLRMDLSTK